MRSGPPRRLVIVALGVALLAGVLVALLQGSDRRAPPPQGGSRFAATASASGNGETLMDALAPLLAGDRAGGAAAPHKSSASLGRAVEQLIVVGIDGTQPTPALESLLHAHAWGGVVLGRSNYSSLTQVAALIAAIRSEGSPLVIVRQAGGNGNALPGLAPSSEPQLGAIGRPDLVNGQAQLSARQLRSLGANATLAPDLDLSEVAGPAAGHAYGSDARLVARLGGAAASGYRAGGLIAIAGHFPGEGAASQDPAKGPATVGLSLPDLQASDVRPFAAVAGSVPVIQMSDAIYGAFDGVTPASLLSTAIRLLRDQVGYRGIVMSGDLAAATVTTGSSVGDAAVAALQAGCELLYVPSSPSDALAAYGAIIEAVANGTLDPAVVARAYGRLLALKQAYRIG
jgi:beta-N-acetylhexosaminidase